MNALSKLQPVTRHADHDVPVADDSGQQGRVVNQGLCNDLKIEKLTYISEMLTELRKLCAGMDERMIAYLIEMALIETNTALNVHTFRMELGTEDAPRRKLGS